MTTNEKRAAITRVYSSESWQRKVKNMSDAQVVAIYRKFLADGKFDRPIIPKEHYKAKYLGEFVFKYSDLPSHDKKEEPAMKPVGNKGYKEDAEQLVMDGFKKTGRAGNSR